MSGKFCGTCGQKLENPVHSVWNFIGEATEDVTHADSRLWRTLLALLFRPGRLTREFLDGRRVYYLPPLRLYLILSLGFFVLATSSPPPVLVVGAQQTDNGPTRIVVTPMVLDDKRPGARSAETSEQRQQRVCGDIHYSGPWQARLEKAFQQACIRSVVDNGRSLQEAFFHAIPRAMFLFLPILALIMTLLYWRPRHYYVEQLLLLVHNHAFIFLFVTLYWLLLMAIPTTAATGWLDTLLTTALAIYLPVYVYLSMRRVYAQSRMLTLSKLAVMSFAYVVSAAVMLIFTSVYSLLSL